MLTTVEGKKSPSNLWRNHGQRCSSSSVDRRYWDIFATTKVTDWKLNIMLEVDHKNRVIINWLLTVCRPWAGQLAQWHGKSLQSCPILCDPMDCSPPDSSARGILQARRLEWVVTPCSRGPSWPRDRTWVSYVPCIGRLVLYHSQPILPTALRAEDSS